MKIVKKFKWDGVFRTLMKHCDQADAAFCFSIKYRGHGFMHPKMNEHVKLFAYGKFVPVGSTIEKSDRAHWYVVKPR